MDENNAITDPATKIAAPAKSEIYATLKEMKNGIADVVDSLAAKIYGYVTQLPEYVVRAREAPGELEKPYERGRPREAWCQTVERRGALGFFHAPMLGNGRKCSVNAVDLLCQRTS